MGEKIDPETFMMSAVDMRGCEAYAKKEAESESTLEDINDMTLLLSNLGPVKTVKALVAARDAFSECTKELPSDEKPQDIPLSEWQDLLQEMIMGGAEEEEEEGNLSMADLMRMQENGELDTDEDDGEEDEDSDEAAPPAKKAKKEE